MEKKTITITGTHILIAMGCIGLALCMWFGVGYLRKKNTPVQTYAPPAVPTITKVAPKGGGIKSIKK